MAGHRTLVRGALAWAVVALCAWPSAAQTPPAGIGLEQALRIALDRAPVIQLARESVKAQEGSVRQAKGIFDLSIEAGPFFEHREDSTTNTGAEEQEKVKRGITKGIGDGFAQVAVGLAEQLKDGRGDLPVCPAEGDWQLYVATLPGTNTLVPLCRPISEEVTSIVFESGDAESSLIVRRPAALDPLASYELQQRLADVYRVQIGSATLDMHEHALELLNTMKTVAYDVATRSLLAYERMHDVPKWQYTNTVSIFGQISKQLRSGSFVQFQATLDGRAGLYREKPIDPIFGGWNNDNRYRSRLELFLTQPLKRGRGADTVMAPTRAAERTAEATRFTYQQTAADQTLATAEAYIDLLAAQESLGLMQQSLVNQRQTLENTIKLVGGGEVPAADVARSRARTAEVEADVSSARLQVIAARSNLAVTMGLSTSDVATLAAADTFPAKPADLDLDQLAKDAVARRADVRAAGLYRDASQIFVTAAKAETRSRFDITLSGGFGQAYYGPTFRSAPDELQYYKADGSTVSLLPNANQDNYIRYYNPTGVGRAFTKRWEPLASVSGYLELPFKNNARLGRLAQARAALSESEIRLADTRRVISANVPKLAEDVRRARAEWEQRQDSVIQYETTWDVSQRQRGSGDITLIDMLLTEQQMTQARQALVQAKRDYAVAVARFRRETGTLVTFTEWSKGQPVLTGVVVSR